MGIALMTKEFLGVYNFPDMKLVLLDEADAFHNVGVAWNKRLTNPIVGSFLHELKEYLKTSPITI